MNDDKRIEVRTGLTPTWGWYWFPHVVFPTHLGWWFIKCGALGFWAFGYKIEIEWDWRRK